MWEPTIEDSFSLTFCNYDNVSDEFIVFNSFCIKKKAIEFSETATTKELTDRSLPIVMLS